MASEVDLILLLIWRSLMPKQDRGLTCHIGHDTHWWWLLHNVSAPATNNYKNPHRDDCWLCINSSLFVGAPSPHLIMISHKNITQITISANIFSSHVLLSPCSLPTTEESWKSMWPQRRRRSSWRGCDPMNGDHGDDAWYHSCIITAAAATLICCLLAATDILFAATSWFRK